MLFLSTGALLQIHFPWYRFRYWGLADLGHSPVPVSVPGARGVSGTRGLMFLPFSLVPVSVLLSIFPGIGPWGRHLRHAFHLLSAGAPSFRGSHPSAKRVGQRSGP